MSVFLNDKDIASELSLSPSWVRKQRWLRRHEEDHVFKVDPVMIGSVPRYRRQDVQEWIDTLRNQRGARHEVR